MVKCARGLALATTSSRGTIRFAALLPHAFESPPPAPRSITLKAFETDCTSPAGGAPVCTELNANACSRLDPISAARVLPITSPLAPGESKEQNEEAKEEDPRATGWARPSVQYGNSRYFGFKRVGGKSWVCFNDDENMCNIGLAGINKDTKQAAFPNPMQSNCYETAADTGCMGSAGNPFQPDWQGMGTYTITMNPMHELGTDADTSYLTPTAPCDMSLVDNVLYGVFSPPPPPPPASDDDEGAMPARSIVGITVGCLMLAGLGVGVWFFTRPKDVHDPFPPVYDVKVVHRPQGKQEATYWQQSAV